MCGIFGISGSSSVLNLLIQGIQKLEYRGYDSAGCAILEKDGIKFFKAVGKVKNLEDKIADFSSTAKVGIVHTRWATHGKPTESNCHPHSGNQNKIALVHNGIIENYNELKKELIAEGAKFLSETDTEVLSVLIEKNYDGISLKDAVIKSLKKIKGAFAICVISNEEPDTIVGARMKSPLVLGVGERELVFASDAIPVLAHTRNIIYLNDGELIEVKDKKYRAFDFDGKQINVEVKKCDLDVHSIAKEGYAHFMLKEIYEQPEALGKTIVGRVHKEANKVVLEDDVLNEKVLKNINRVVIIGCGTAWHAGLIGRNIIERIAGLPVQVDYASEFRYRDPLVDKNTLVIAISQSGETADTLGAIELAKEKGAHTFAIVNVVGSTMTREADEVLHTRAGPEIGVASTKAFTSQIVALYLVGIHIGTIRRHIEEKEIKRRLDNLEKLPNIVKEVLESCEDVPRIAEKYHLAHHALFLGRGTGYPIALEGALKLKEISYIHAEGYHAAELKHGPIALIDELMPVFVLALKGRRFPKIQSNVEEVKARGGKIIAIVSKGDTQLKGIAEEIIYINDELGILNSILAVIPMQLISYYIAVARGCDVDQPRNLAKSVTVE